MCFQQAKASKAGLARQAIQTAAIVASAHVIKHVTKLYSYIPNLNCAVCRFRMKSHDFILRTNMYFYGNVYMHYELAIRTCMQYPYTLCPSQCMASTQLNTALKPRLKNFFGVQAIQLYYYRVLNLALETMLEVKCIELVVCR